MKKPPDREASGGADVHTTRYEAPTSVMVVVVVVIVVQVAVRISRMLPADPAAVTNGHGRTYGAGLSPPTRRYTSAIRAVAELTYGFMPVEGARGVKRLPSGMREVGAIAAAEGRILPYLLALARRERRRFLDSSARRSAGLVVVLVLLFAVAALLLQSAIGLGVTVLAVVPVAFAAARLGLGTGLAVALATSLLTYALWDLLGVIPSEAVVRVGSGYGVVVAIIVAAVVGQFHDARQELRREHGRLADAIRKREEDLRLLVQEITNPLLGIELAAQVLSGEEPGTLEVRSTAAQIAREARGVRELVGSLTEEARIEGGGRHLTRQPIELVALARETVAGFDAGDREVVFTVTVRSDTLPVRGDPVALQRVLRILMSNAVLYSHGGAIRVEASASDDGKLATVAVRDEGPAIPVGERHLLFQKFARLSTAGGTSGAGLGLRVSHLVIGDHGGQLSASWPRGGGNVFSFSLPITTQETATSASAPPRDGDDVAEDRARGRVSPRARPRE